MRDDSSRVTEAQKQKPEITKLNRLYRVLISLLDIYIYSIESSIYFGPMVVSLCIMSLCSVHFISAIFIIIITTFYFPLLLVGNYIYVSLLGLQGFCAFISSFISCSTLCSSVSFFCCYSLQVQYLLKLINSFFLWN